MSSIGIKMVEPPVEENESSLDHLKNQGEKIQMIETATRVMQLDGNRIWKAEICLRIIDSKTWKT